MFKSKKKTFHGTPEYRRNVTMIWNNGPKENKKWIIPNILCKSNLFPHFVWTEIYRRNGQNKMTFINGVSGLYRRKCEIFFQKNWKNGAVRFWSSVSLKYDWSWYWWAQRTRRVFQRKVSMNESVLLRYFVLPKYIQYQRHTTT